MKKYVFLLFVFALGVYTCTVVHASPHLQKHDYGTVINANYDEVAVIDVAVVTNTVDIPVLMVVDLPKQCAALNIRTEAPRIRWQHAGNNYYSTHPPELPFLSINSEYWLQNNKHRL